MEKAKYLLFSFLFVIIALFQLALPAFLHVQDAQAQDLWSMQKDTMDGSGQIGEVFNGSAGATQDLRTIVITVIKIFLGLLGLYFTILIIMAGFKWMNSRGNDDQVKIAKSQLKNAIIGMIVIICAYAISDFVIIYAECIVEGDCEW